MRTKNKNDKHNIGWLWKRRAYIIRAFILRFALNTKTRPDKVMDVAKKKSKHNIKVKLLLTALMEIREKLYLFYREKFGVFYSIIKIKYGEEVGILDYTLLKCIDRCRIGKENTFEKYFLIHIKRVFSDLEDLRTTNIFSIPRDKKLFLRRIRRFFTEEELKKMKYDQISSATGIKSNIVKTLLELSVDDYVDELVSPENPEEKILSEEEKIQLFIKKHNQKKKYWWQILEM